MTLVKDTLKNEFLKLLDDSNPQFAGWPADIVSVANNWTTAYTTYAIQATDVSGDILVTANAPGFTSTLSSGLASSLDATAAAAAFDNAFVTYWTGAVFAIGIPPTPAICPNVGGNFIFSTELTSTVSVVVAGTLSNLLIPIFLDIASTMTADSKADQIATAFHIATTTAISVLITGLDTTPTPSGPLPITNTCTIF